MATRIIKKNKWARIKSENRGEYYLVEASGPHGWIAQSDYSTKQNAERIYKRLSSRTGLVAKKSLPYPHGVKR
jgi:hypothetical protein